MDNRQLRERLRAILNLEAAESVDWSRVQQLCAELDQQISEASEYEPPHLVHHYLDDADIREKDSAYGDTQRSQIKRFVETGDRNGVESRPMSTASCLLVVALVVALAAWLVL